MGLASSSAARFDEASAYRSLGGLGGARKLKKKPVLVLDPEELAKAHMLFQIGAAEQMGEYDPHARAPRSMPIFGLAAVNEDDDEPFVVPLMVDDDYVAPIVLDDEEEEPEEDLPPIDLTAILAMTPNELEAEDEYYQSVAEYEADEDEVCSQDSEAGIAGPDASSQAQELEVEQPAANSRPAQPGKLADTPSEALARIISRASSQSNIAPPTPKPEIASPDIAVEANKIAAPSEPLPEIEPAPLDIADIAEPELPQPASNAEAEAEASADDDWLLLHQLEQDEPANEAPPVSPAPQPVARVFEAGPQNQLRSRLMREELPVEEPSPSVLSRIMFALRRMFGG